MDNQVRSVPRSPDDSPEQLLAWRRRALDQQLPAAAFPAGTTAPSLAYLWATMLVVAVAILGFSVNADRAVPPAVVDSQLDLVSRLAAAIQTSARTTAEELDGTVAGRGGATDEDLLARVVADGGPWIGAAIVANADRRPVATRGAEVPVGLLPAVLPAGSTVAVTTPDDPMLVRGVVLDPDRTLLAVQPLTMRNLRLNPDAGHGIFMLTPDGGTSLMQGANAVDATHLPKILEGLPESTSRQSREVLVKEWSDRRLVVSSAPVRGTGLVVASVLTADVTEGTSAVTGLLLGLSLLAVAAPAFLLMRMFLVRPVRALLRQAKADACGATTTTRPTYRIVEAYRIDRALALTSGAGLAPGRRWRPTVLQGLTVAVVIALLWPVAAVVVTLRMPTASIPAQLVNDKENRAEEASSALGNALDGGLQSVRQVARSVDPGNRTGATRLVEKGLADERRLRALYLVDRDGTVLTRAGREPLRTTGPLPGETGVHLDPSITRLPVVYAYHRVRGDGHALIGEFDPDRLLGLVRRIDGRVRVVDSELRTVLDSVGYQAFQLLEGDTAREVAVEALPGDTVSRSADADGEPVLIAAAGLATPVTVAHLEWSVVVEQQVAALRLPQLIERRWTLLVAGAVVGIVLLTQMWQLYIFVRPLRRLAAVADRIADGSVDVPVPPQRHDDIGAVAMCLEICRQVRHTGSARFGGTIRIRGSEANFTKVLPRVRRPAATAAREG
ncbi:HAMP domain-containing protein [Micromonospora sp. NPDC000207]|uniref:HAMP domain-containing protein n=1 Tax=Micromonospora sp. NPDC000207 TaxID=3154246 RepID=UPI00332EA60B